MDVAIVMNNYLHDVATATLLVSAVIMYVLGRRAEDEGAQAVRALVGFYPLLTRFAWGAVAWIVVGGIPRTVFFNSHELIPAVEKGLYLALVVKHTLMFTAVVVGVLLWRSVKRRLELAAARAE